MRKNIIILVFVLSTTFTFAQSTTKVEDPNWLQLIIDYGKTYIGTPYSYGGGASSKGFDCSGFVCYVFKMGGQVLPRSSRDIATVGKTVPLNEAKKGDLLFFKTSSSGSISHVGIVSEIKDNKVIMLHSSTTYGVQEIDIMSSDYWRSRLVLVKALD